MPRKIIPYNPELKLLARKLRNDSTKSEVILWKHLRNKQLGYRFNRQKPINNFIIDFFCYDLMLAIEIDGYSHSIEEVYNKDLEKETTLKELGIRLIRIQDQDIFNNLSDSLDALIQVIKQIEKHSPSAYFDNAQHRSQEGNNK